MFHRFPAHFDPFTSIWELLVKMKIDMKNVDFTRFSYKYLICGFNSEISTWKLIFQKVQMILYILPIYHFFISCILNELCSSENTCEIIRFGDKCFKIFTSELTKSTVEKYTGSFNKNPRVNKPPSLDKKDFEIWDLGLIRVPPS